MRTDRTLFMIASGGVLAGAVASAVLATRRARRAWRVKHEWHIDESDVLLDLVRLG